MTFILSQVVVTNVGTTNVVHWAVRVGWKTKISR